MENIEENIPVFNRTPAVDKLPPLNYVNEIVYALKSWAQITHTSHLGRFRGKDSSRQVAHQGREGRGYILGCGNARTYKPFRNVAFREAVEMDHIVRPLHVGRIKKGLRVYWVGVPREMEWTPRFNADATPLLADNDLHSLFRSQRIQEGSVGSLFLQGDTVAHRLSGTLHFSGLVSNCEASEGGDDDQPPVGPLEGCVPFWRAGVGCFCMCAGLGFILFSRDAWGRWLPLSGGGILFFFGTGVWLTGHYRCDSTKSQHSDIDAHDGIIVTQKYLTSSYLCNTVIYMANVLSAEKQTAIIAALAEGSSIRSIERITGVHRDTIMRLGVYVGKGCEMLLDSKMQDLACRYLQFDEVWGFIGKKERHVRIDDNPELGDVWTYCAIDAETKLVPTFKVGKRNRATTTAFVQDVASRLRNRVQISTDALHGYVEAVEQSFGADVDYGQIVKVYTHDDAQHPERKYSAPHFASAMRRPITGNPEMELVSTSYVERLNATTRLHVKRLSRLTLAFSKKLENFQAAVALHFAYYNFVRRHNALRCTPAMAAGIERDFWSVGDLVEAAI